MLQIDELLSWKFPPREPIIGDWLLTQGLAMVYAWRGTGKTYFTLWLSYAVACGSSFLNWHAPKPRRVLYVDGEMPGATLQKRLADIAVAFDHEPEPDYLSLLTPDVQPEGMPDLADKEGQALLDLAVGQTRAELIVLDNLSCLIRSGKAENDAECWLPVASWALAHRKAGRSILFVHHSGKSGAQRGTSKKEDLLDSVLALKRPCDYQQEQGARFEVFFEKHRNAYGQGARPFEAMLTTNERKLQTWTIKDLDDCNRERIIELHRAGLSNAEIAGELAINRSTVHRNLKAAERDGLIETQKKGGKR